MDTDGAAAEGGGSKPGGCEGGCEDDEDGAPMLLDMLWLDFGLGSGPRIEAFLDAWWPRLRHGGLLLMHSTLTNAVTRAWLEKQRDRARPGGGGTLEPPPAAPPPPGPAQPVLASIHEDGEDLAPSDGHGGTAGGHNLAAVPPRASRHLCAFESISLLEPHKMYQNACSIFQKRDGGWSEPVLTSYP